MFMSAIRPRDAVGNDVKEMMRGEREREGTGDTRLIGSPEATFKKDQSDLEDFGSQCAFYLRAKPAVCSSGTRERSLLVCTPNTQTNKRLPDRNSEYNMS